MFRWLQEGSICVKDGKNASCWFAVKANTDFDLKLFAAMTCWSCWHLLMTICCLVLTPQHHNQVSFCKLSSFCRQCRGENDWKRRWKIGHSCSPYFLNIPLSAASTPASQPTQSHLPTTSSWHTHRQFSAEFQTSRFKCLFSRYEGKKDKKKKGFTFQWTCACQGRGLEKGGGGGQGTVL